MISSEHPKCLKQIFLYDVDNDELIKFNFSHREELKSDDSLSCVFYEQENKIWRGYYNSIAFFYPKIYGGSYPVVDESKRFKWFDTFEKALECRNCIINESIFDMKKNIIRLENLLKKEVEE